MKFLLILLITLVVILSIAEAEKVAKKTNKSPITYRNARKTSYRELVKLMDDEENDEDELDDEEDDDDDDDDNDLDDESGGSDNYGGVRFPQFHELFPNPDGRPAGPNSYEAYLKHMPKAQKQGQPQQSYSHGHPPPSPVRRNEHGPAYQGDDVPPPRKRKISKKTKTSKKKKSRPAQEYDDSPPPRRGAPPPGYYEDDSPQGPPPPGYYQEGPPPSGYYEDSQQGPPPPGYYENSQQGPPPPGYYENSQQGPPPPGYYEDEDAPQRGPPPSEYYDDAPPQHKGHPKDQHIQGHPLNFQHHGPPQKGGKKNEVIPGYPKLEVLPQGGEATQLFELPSLPFRLPSLFGRSDIPKLNQQGMLSRRLLSESDEVSGHGDSSGQVQSQQDSAPVVVEDVPSKPKVKQPTLFNRPGHGSSMRPGFGTNRYYSPSTQDTRYFRPITNRIYSDYQFVPQGGFVMDGYRPSYRPRYETTHELEQSPRRSSDYRPYVIQRQSDSGYYAPWSNRVLPTQYNPEYVVNPSQMLSRRQYRYQKPQRVPMYNNGYWGNARNTYVHPWAGRGQYYQ